MQHLFDLLDIFILNSRRQYPPCRDYDVAFRPFQLISMEQFFLQPDGMPFLEIRTTLGSVLPYDAHFHTQFSVGVILEGQTRFFLDGEPHIARKGDIVLIAPRRVHSCNPINGQPRGYHMLFFDGAWFAENVAAPLWGKCELNVTEPVLTDPALFFEGIRLVDAVRSGLMETDRFLHWLSTVLSRAKALPQTESVRQAGESEAEAFPSLDDAVSCSIAALASKAHMRRESYSRFVRRKTGLPPQAWLHCLRIEKGRFLLRQGKSIAEAALETGYVDQSHFHRMFRRIVCATPGCYQKIRSHLYKK